MSSPGDLLLDAFGRLPELVKDAVDGLTQDQLAHRLAPETNTIAWLVWHLARVEDISLADAFGSQQVWLVDRWSDRFDLPFEPSDMGYGHSSDQVSAVRAPPELLVGYYTAVSARTAEHLRFVSGEDLDRVVDRSFDPPVTLGVRLVSVLEDVTQHVGQVAFASGLVTRS